jgi:hypothetical protein
MQLHALTNPNQPTATLDRWTEHDVCEGVFKLHEAGPRRVYGAIHLLRVKRGSTFMFPVGGKMVYGVRTRGAQSAGTIQAEFELPLVPSTPRRSVRPVVGWVVLDWVTQEESAVLFTDKDVFLASLSLFNAPCVLDRVGIGELP